MAKRRSAPKEVESPASVTSSPFGALASLRDALPGAPNTSEAVATHSRAEPEPAATIRSASKGGKIVVRRETKGRKGKTVTRISGLSPTELAPLSKKLKKALGCGASVEGEDLVLLGSLVDRTADWLESGGAKRVVRSD